MKLPRHAEIWLQPYFADRARRWWGAGAQPIRHVWVAIADHYEPFWNRADPQTARRRVDAWRKRWPPIAARNAAGADAPRYTFFYPEEQYQPDILESLAGMTRQGVADVEVHIHHGGQGREDFITRIRTFCRRLEEDHGLLRRVDGRVRFGFIHGNWALDNSLPEGRYCGLNDEITLLRDLGCYADFTMPSGASPSQAQTINTIYCCTDDPSAPKSYDRGTSVQLGKGIVGDLTIIPGPLGMRWRGRFLPRMETGELAAYDPATAYRAKRWFDLAPRIGEHAFLKLYTHGATESNLEMLLNRGLDDLFRFVREEAHRRSARVHFVSTWEMYLAVEALSRGDQPQYSKSAALKCEIGSSDVSERTIFGSAASTKP